MSAHPPSVGANEELQRFAAAAAEARRLYDSNPPDDDDGSHAQVETIWSATWSAVQHPAATIEDLRCKAAAAVDMIVWLRAPLGSADLPDDEEDVLRIAVALLRQVAQAEPQQDARLIADCTAFCDLERQVHAIHGDQPEHDAERDRLDTLQQPIVDGIVGGTAHTIEGHPARARCLIEWSPDVVAPGGGDVGGRLLHALLAGLVGPSFVAETLERMHRGNQEDPASVWSRGHLIGKNPPNPGALWMSADSPERNLLRLVAGVVSAHVSHNAMLVEELPAYIRTVHGAFSKVGAPAAAEVTPRPAVPIKKSVFPDYIVCLEDGKHLKMLKRHLWIRYGLTPEVYRHRWGLPDSYPMVAPNYATRRSSIAKQAGLGRKATTLPPPEVEVQRIPAGITGKGAARKKRTAA